MKEFERLVKTMKSGADAAYVAEIAKNDPEKRNMLVKELLKRISLGQVNLEALANAILLKLF
jgi:hypothetical protein